jgi:hypothetical protein
MSDGKPLGPVRRGRILGAICILAIVVSLAWAGFEQASNQREGQRLDGALERLLAVLNLEGRLTTEERLDAVRRFIHSNSRHGDDAEFRELLGKKDRIAEEIIAFARGQRSEPVHMLCGARSNLMSAVLEKLVSCIYASSNPSCTRSLVRTPSRNCLRSSPRPC